MNRRTFTLALVSSLVASAAHAQVTLTWKPQEAPVVTRTTVKVDQTLNLAGMDLPTSANARMAVRTAAGKPAADGTVRVTQKTEAFALDLSLPGGLMASFDSAKTDNKTDVPQLQPLMEVYKALSGASYTYVLGKDGKVNAVEGVEKILQAAPPEAAEPLKSELNPDRLKREFAQEIAKLPDAPVKQGDRWQRTELMNLGAGQTLTFTYFYEYAGTVEKGGKTYDKVNIFHSDVAYAIEPNPALPAKVVNHDLKISESSGSYLFDRAAGRIFEITDRVRIAGPLTLDIMGMALPGKVDFVIDSTSTTAPAAD